ncbi:MAG: cytochrome c oxidase assembly protein [Paracoccus sp. (in: a-proteobacteria)]|uniref:cytochrome c oxidase assembly protein n=1 Tax=Paracoccus sp. TaxID=267 RepID=UPI0040586126
MIQQTPYCGPAPAPGQIWTAWNLDPLLLAALAVAGAALWFGTGRRGAAAMALAALAVAFVSPLCALTVALFAARSVHHLLLITVAAPALALAFPILARLPASLSLGAVTAAMVAWHLPAVYAAVWASDSLYWAMQAAMLLPAWAFWSAILKRDMTAEDAMRRALLVGGLAGIMGLIGALLTFAPGILYLQHIDGAAAWGLGALADQQLAGLLMWVPGFLPLAALAAVVLRRGWKAGFAA